MIYLLMGNWYLLSYFVAIGMICEAILWKDCSERNPKQIIASWTVASLLYNGVNLLPIWFFWETYYSFAKNRTSIMRKISFAIITKIWGFICVLIAIYMGKDVIFSTPVKNPTTLKHQKRITVFVKFQ